MWSTGLPKCEQEVPVERRCTWLREDGGPTTPATSLRRELRSHLTTTSRVTGPGWVQPKESLRNSGSRPVEARAVSNSTGNLNTALLHTQQLPSAV